MTSPNTPTNNESKRNIGAFGATGVVVAAMIGTGIFTLSGVVGPDLVTTDRFVVAWIVAAIGVVLDGCSCFLIPWCTNYFMLMLPICILCFGIAMVDTALLPTLGYIVDKVTRIIRLTPITRSRTRFLAQKYVSVYGSVYAIADISYSAAYAIGPVIAGHIVEMFGFTALNIIVGLVSLAYAPILYFLKDMHSYKVFITLDVSGERETHFSS